MMSIDEQRDEQRPARVRATYEDSELLFDIPPTATLEQVAAVLASAGRGHGAPVCVEVITEPIPLRG
jgi:hypothetical protein